MPLIVPTGLDLPLEYVTRAWYTEASSTASAGVALSLAAEIPDGAAVWQLFSCDVRKNLTWGDGSVWLSVAGKDSPRVTVSSMERNLRRHHFLQHLWLNLPAGLHTFQAHWDPSGASMLNRMMALLLLKR